MTKQPASTIGPAAKCAVMRLMLAFFVLRAFVPVGFMPGSGSAAGDGLQIVICTGTGAKSVQVDRDWRPVDADKSNKTDLAGDQECPFFKALAKPFSRPLP